MKAIYVAGPYRADLPWAIERNIRQAEDLAAVVWSLGAVAVCPHQLTRPFGGLIQEDRFLAAGLELLARCDAVIVTAAWANSEGTVAEMHAAFGRGIPVFLYVEHLADWLAGGKRRQEIALYAVETRDRRAKSSEATRQALEGVARHVAQLSNETLAGLGPADPPSLWRRVRGWLRRDGAA